MESEQINNYAEMFGEKPIGNINDEANKRERSFVDKKLFVDLFEEEEKQSIINA